MNDIVICPPLREVGGHTFDPNEAPYAQYLQVLCPRCRQWMWLGSRGRVEVEAGRASMLCAICALQVFGPALLVSKLTDRDS